MINHTEKKETEVKQTCCVQSGKKNTSISIEYLYLDKNTCTRCNTTDEVLEKTLSVISPALELAGYSITLQKIQITDEETARRYRFLSSPTIRVNGADIFGSIEENNCTCCSDISGNQVNCRSYTYNGITSETPSVKLTAKAILSCVFNPPSFVCGGYILPENLKNFFKGKKTKSACSCGCN